MIKDSCGQNRMGYILYNIVALISLLMATDLFAVCGAGDTCVMAFQMIKYLPQAMMMLIGPILTYITYLEPIPVKWKVIKFLIIGVLFTISMLTTLKFGLPILEEVYGGSVQTKLLLLPITFYLNLAVGILTQIGILKWEKEILHL